MRIQARMIVSLAFLMTTVGACPPEARIHNVGFMCIATR
jgi:hypothetical protein